MTKGRKPDPQRAKRGTGHRPPAGESIVEYVPQHHDLKLRESLSRSLPAGAARRVFKNAVTELGDKIRDNDLEALALMARHYHNALEAQKLVDKYGLAENTPFGMKVNPFLKAARDEEAAYLKIAERYALTFVSRLQAGILQLAGQSMMQQIHHEMADAIVARILEK